MGYESMDAIAFWMETFGFWLERSIASVVTPAELRNTSTATGVTSAKARRVLSGAASTSIEAAELDQILPFAARFFAIWIFYSVIGY